jgi:hypothetical protein
MTASVIALSGLNVQVSAESLHITAIHRSTLTSRTAC